MRMEAASGFTLDEELWFGDVSAEAEAEREAAASLAARIAQIQGLKPFPVAAQRLLASVRDPDFDVGEVAALIEGDVSLAARVLKVVNAAAFGLARRCNTVHHAVVLLGARTISELAAALVVMDMFKGNDALVSGLRRHAAGTATIGRQLATSIGLPDENVFTGGLLHDLGKLLLLQSPEPDYPTLLASAPMERDAVHARERRIYGYDHAVLAGHVLAAWKVPAPLPQVVAWHHQPVRAYEAGGRVAQTVALVRLADRIAHAVARVESGGEADPLDALARDEAATYLGVDASLMTELWVAFLDAWHQGTRLVA